MREFPSFLKKEFSVFKKLNTPIKIQNFLDTLPINFEQDKKDTCRSPRSVLNCGEAHCIEGALLAVAALWYHGHKPLLLDLKTTDDDSDHVVALFRHNHYWGAISKTNHSVLRFRDPIFKTIRELALSYFNEYYLDTGKKTLRSYSRPYSLLSYEDDWLTSDEDVWGVHDDLDSSPHYPIVPKYALKSLRLADPIEIKAGKLTEWKFPK